MLNKLRTKSFDSFQVRNIPTPSCFDAMLHLPIYLANEVLIPRLPSFDGYILEKLNYIHICITYETRLNLKVQ